MSIEPIEMPRPRYDRVKVYRLSTTGNTGELVEQFGDWDVVLPARIVTVIGDTPIACTGDLYVAFANDPTVLQLARVLGAANGQATLEIVDEYGRSKRVFPLAFSEDNLVLDGTASYTWDPNCKLDNLTYRSYIGRREDHLFPLDNGWILIGTRLPNRTPYIYRLRRTGLTRFEGFELEAQYFGQFIIAGQIVAGLRCVVDSTAYWFYTSWNTIMLNGTHIDATTADGHVSTYTVEDGKERVTMVKRQ